MVPAYSLSVLRRRAEFLMAAQSGKKWVAPGLILQVVPLSSISDAACVRYGLTASSKIGNAVIRNRARRRLRALVRNILHLHAAPAYAYVLIARASTATRDHRNLVGDLTTALRKLKLWHE